MLKLLFYFRLDKQWKLLFFHIFDIEDIELFWIMKNSAF